MCVCAVRYSAGDSGNPANGIQLGSSVATATGNSMTDISECLKDIPLDWLSDAANLLNHTLHFNSLTPNLLSSNGNSNSGYVDDGEVSAIVCGVKQVSVPPGNHFHLMLE